MTGIGAEIPRGMQRPVGIVDHVDAGGFLAGAAARPGAGGWLADPVE